jgi:molybdenum cofactor synthesis domain-containing protein
VGDSDLPLHTVRAAVLTVSDRASQGVYADASGTLIQQQLQQQGAEVVASALTPDGRERVSAELIRLTDAFQPDLILTTGGTGLAPGDCTPEATRAIVEREASCLAEWLRYQTGQSNALGYLSRATAGVRGRTLIINLPGAPRAVQECLRALRPLLPHAVAMVRGGDHRQQVPENG